MKFKNIALMAVLTAPSALPMSYGFDYTNVTDSAAPAIERKFNAEAQRENQAVTTLADAFGALPKKNQQTEKEKQDFKGKLRAGLPVELQELIGGFVVKNHDFINEHLMRLIPCVVERHAWYPSMKKLVDEVLKGLNYHHLQHREQLIVRDQPYIIATAGFWSFNDEASKFRWKEGARNFSTDLTQWLGLHYPQNPVKPLADNEWVAVLYSDGKIQWHVSARNRVRLKNLTNDQLALCIAPWLSAFWKTSDVLPADHHHREAYHALPTHIRKALHSNFDIALSSFEKYTHKTLQCAKSAAVALAVAYWGYKVGLANNSFDSYMKMDQVKGIKKVLSILLSGCGAALFSQLPHSVFIISYMKYLYKMTNKTGRDVVQVQTMTDRDIKKFLIQELLAPLAVANVIGLFISQHVKK